MSLMARQSTARTYMVGPVLDADGVAVTDGVVADFKISKNGAAPGALDGSATLTHRNTGHYSLALTANDLDTVGTAQVTIDDTVNSCPMLPIQVVEEAVYDRDYAASATGYIANQPVDLNTIKTQTVTCGAGVTVLASVGTAATSTAQTGDCYARLGAPAGASVSADILAIDNLVDDLESRVGTPSDLGGGATIAANLSDIEAQTDDIGAAGAGLTAADDAILTILGTPAGASLAADVAAVKSQTAAIETDTAEIGVAGAGLTNINLPNQTMDIVGNITGNLSGSVGSVTGAVGSVTGAVGSVTGSVGGNVTGSVGSIATGGIAAASFAAGAIDAAAIANGAIDAATFAADVDAEILSYLVDDATRIDASSLNTATVTTIPAIVADTNELQTDWANGGRLDLIVDAILDDTGTSGVVVASGSKTGYSLAAAGLDAVLIESSISAGASLTNDTGTQLTSVNGRQAISVIMAGVLGVSSGAGTSAITFKAGGNASSNNRLSATVTPSTGERTAVAVKVPD